MTRKGFGCVRCPARSVRKPFPDWVDYTPNQIWIYDTTHLPRSGMAVLAIEDLVSRG